VLAVKRVYFLRGGEGESETRKNDVIERRNEEKGNKKGNKEGNERPRRERVRTTKA
jgi:hypothetical protein